MHVTEDFVGWMSGLFRVLLNPGQIVFNSNINTGKALGAACGNQKADSRMHFIE
jgi:hypothetical protein